MKKQYIFFIFLIFACNAANQPILNKEELLKKFSEQKVDQQGAILSEIAVGYSTLKFINKNIEIFQKDRLNKLNGRDHAFGMTDKERFKMNIFFCCQQMKSISFKDENATQFIDEFQKFIFRKFEGQIKISENLDKVESIKEETKSFFVDAQKIFKQKLNEKKAAS